ncbi:MAG: DUF3536 domain-containing protein, partial [Thermoplasmata archaeon]
VAGARVDPTHPYRVSLPSGRSLAVFFYDGPISQAIAFEGLLDDGGRFAERLLGGFPTTPSEGPPGARLVHVATDGETYGHHHRHGDMALAYALDRIAHDEHVRLTNYAEFLERFPPTWEAVVIENTSWSCVHGVERWRANCGCSTLQHPAWQQAWRGPLREALDWLRDSISDPFERVAKRYLRDPWEARTAYYDVLRARDDASREGFLDRHALRPLRPEEAIVVWKLMELERHLQLMYTSCGWFFDDISGIETAQVLGYAARAVQLAREGLAVDLESEFVARLERAPSNVPAFGTGGGVYARAVRPTEVDLQKVCAHFAVNSLFEPYGARTQVYCFDVESLESHRERLGRVRLALGVARVTSRVTREAETLTWGVVHFGDLNLSGGVRAFRGMEAYRSLVTEARAKVHAGDLAGAVALMTTRFDGLHYSLRSLFRDEQRRAVDAILATALADSEHSLRAIYEGEAPLMQYLRELGTPLPRTFEAAADLIVNIDLRRALEQESVSLEEVSRYLEEAQRWGVPLDAVGLGQSPRRLVERTFAALRDVPLDLERLRAAGTALEIARRLPYTPELGRVQNAFYELMTRVLPDRRAAANAGDADAAIWVAEFVRIGQLLSVSVA